MHLLKRVIDQIKKFQVTGDFYAYDNISPFENRKYRNLGIPNIHAVAILWEYYKSKLLKR